jgi:hypothetical protein
MNSTSIIHIYFLVPSSKLLKLKDDSTRSPSGGRSGGVVSMITNFMDGLNIQYMVGRIV